MRIRFGIGRHCRFLLLFLSATVFIAEGGRQVCSQTVLAYSRQQNQQKMSSDLKAPGGYKYRVFLTPDLDSKRHVVVLDFVLQNLGRKRDKNLLGGTSKLHGYQPYIFAATDFAQGVDRSAFGEVRTISLFNPKIKVIVKVVGVNVFPIAPASPQSPGYEFTNLTLEIATEGESGGPHVN